MNATLLGLCIGDALGVPFESCAGDFFQKHSWDGKYTTGAHNLPLGAFSDDGKMAIYLSKSIIDNKGFLTSEVANSYVSWLETGDLRGIGKQTLNALTKIKNGSSLNESGKIVKLAKIKFKRKDGPDLDAYCGNGTVMRVAPIGVFFRETLDLVEDYAIVDAIITHNHIDATDSSLAMASMIYHLVNGADPIDAVSEAMHALTKISPNGNVLMALSDALKPEETVIKHGINGSAHATLATAVWCFLNNQESYIDTVLSAIKLGGDTDTRAAVAGALSGTYLGIEGIPSYYVDNIEDSATLQAIDKLLYMGPSKLQDIQVKFLP
jgi:ADP-ribosyl-[dinitrogen reductase] hydrolase